MADTPLRLRYAHSSAPPPFRSRAANGQTEAIRTTYVPRLPPDAALDALGLRPVSDAGKVWLHLPDDEGVFLETQTVKELPLVSGAQIYLDLQPVGVSRPVPLPPASDAARKLDWSEPPLVLWQHVMQAKPDATVHATAGEHPAILARPFGKGKVCFVTIAPLGDAPAGQTAFWDWPQWPLLMKSVIVELTTSMTNR